MWEVAFWPHQQPKKAPVKKSTAQTQAIGVGPYIIQFYKGKGVAVGTSAGYNNYNDAVSAASATIKTVWGGNVITGYAVIDSNGKTVAQR